MVVGNIYGYGKTTEGSKEQETEAAAINSNAKRESVCSISSNAKREGVCYEKDKTEATTNGGVGELYSKVEEKQEKTDKNEDKEEEKDEELEKSARVLTEGDYAALVREGYYPENMDAAELSEALLKLKKQSVKELTENTSDTEEKPIELIEKIKRKLREKKLPVTDDNIEAVMNAMLCASESLNMSEKTYAYMLDNQLEPSAENIYKAVHATNGEYKRTQISDEVWAQLSKGAEAVIEKANLEVNEKSLKDAKWLVESNIPLTEENLKYMSELTSLKEDYSEDEMLNRITDSILNMTDAKDTLLTREVGSAEPDYDSVTVIRHLEEERLKLLKEAGAVIDANGFVVDLEGIEENIERLKAIEDRLCSEMLKEAGIEPDTEGAVLFKDTMDTLYEISRLTAGVLSDTFENRHDISLDELNKAGRTDTEVRAEQAYEALKTEPRRDMGDSIKRAFQNVDDILSELKLEATEANRRAVRILGYNSIEINENNINEMKYYDSKVNGLIKDMKPSVVLELIRQEVNPLNENIDKLSEKAADIINESGYSKEERYSNFLVEAESSKSITATEREAYIGIYRLLYQVEKSDGAAVGALVNSKKEFTLGNLLTEVRTAKSGHIEAEVDDSFGAAEKAAELKNNIEKQILSGINDNGATAYYQSLTDRIFNSLTPDKLKKLIKGGEAENLSLEQLAEQAEGIDGEADEIALRQRVQEIQALVKEAVFEKSLLKEYEIPLTINNLLAAKGLKKGKGFSDTLSESGSEEQESIDFTRLSTKEELDEACEELEANAEKMVEKGYLDETVDSEKLKLLRMAGNEIRFSRELRKRNYYNLPIEINGERTNMRLTIQSGEEYGLASISTELAETGRIEAQLKLAGNKADIFVLAESQKSMETLRKGETELKKAFSTIGIDSEHINYGVRQLDAEAFKARSRQGSEDNEKTAEGDDRVETNRLLSAVKAFLTSLNS